LVKRLRKRLTTDTFLMYICQALSQKIG
jgi:hypothetical protein